VGVASERKRLVRLAILALGLLVVGGWTLATLRWVEDRQWLFVACSVVALVACAMWTRDLWRRHAKASQ
jgi:hypothetical protein